MVQASNYFQLLETTFLIFFLNSAFDLKFGNFTRKSLEHVVPQLFEAVLYFRATTNRSPSSWILVLKKNWVAVQFNQACKIYKRCSIVYGCSYVQSMAIGY